MTITIIGHGYVGLVTACVFANFGNQVGVIGRTPEKIKKLNGGDPLIYEPGLEELLQKNLEARRLKFTLDYDPTIKNSQVVFIAVGTPSGDNGEANLSQVFSVAEKIAENLKDDYTVVSCKSTVPVGTNRKIKEIISRKINSSVKFDVVSTPEFLREGTGISDTTHPDRILIGSESKKATKIMLDLHREISGERVVTNLASAELIKYASNSMLATKISFANLISFYCEKSGANAEQVLSAVGLDNRIGSKFLNPGIGYGGACFPKDVKALIHTGHELQVNTGLLDEVENINKLARNSFAEKIIKNSKGKKLGIWGLSFKPNTDDVREAPSIFIIKKLLENNFEITAYDPEAMKHIQKQFGNKIKFVDDPYKVSEGTDNLAIFTEWNEFKQIDLKRVKKLMRGKVIFDGRNIYDLDKMKELGFEYHSVGRKTISV
ncbi:MAG: UDP-glucose/GDP-mannose dehydrogenase family protein [Patescibacteria group bacterium]